MPASFARLLPLLLALPLSLAAETALAPALAPTVGVAHATDFTGKIKRIKIKKKRVGSGFKVVTVSQSNDGAVATTSAVTLTDPATGAVVSSGEATTTRGARARWAGALSADVAAGEVLVRVSATSLVDGALAFDPVAVTVDATGSSPWGEAALETGHKVRVRLKDGAVRAVVTHEDGGWVPVEVSDVQAAVSTAEGAGLGSAALTLGDVVQRFVVSAGDLSAYEGTDLVVSGSVGLVDGAGVTLRNGNVDLPETLEEIMTVEFSGLVDDGSGDTGGLTSAIERVRLAETRQGDVKLVAVTTTLPGVTPALEVAVTDEATGEDALVAFDESPVGTARIFEAGALAFDPGDSPAGYPYLVLLDRLDEAGNPTGAQTETTVTFEAPADGEAWAEGEVVATFPWGDDEGTGVAVANADGSVTFAVGYRGEGVGDTASVNLIFEEPFEGPAPLETEVRAPLVLQLDKWVSKGDVGVTGAASVTVGLVDGDGGQLDAIGTSGSSTGTVYRAAGNGKGTRKAAANLAQNVQLTLL